jgi:hypothetical protein
MTSSLAILLADHVVPRLRGVAGVATALSLALRRDGLTGAQAADALLLLAGEVEACLALVEAVPAHPDHGGGQDPGGPM